MSDISKLLTMAQVSARTGLSLHTLRRYRAKNTGPASFKLGGTKVVYREEDVASWIDAARAAHPTNKAPVPKPAPPRRAIRVDVEFGPLPEVPRDVARDARQAWAEGIAEALRSRPGEWAKVHTSSNEHNAARQANNIRTGKMPAYAPAGLFSAAARGNDVWVRYNGGRA